MAIEEVIAAARPLADMIWSREIEGGTFATPERRAALEARTNELSNGIRDEVVRRYYRQDLAERLLHLAGARRTVVRVLGQAALDQVCQLRRTIGQVRLQRLRHLGPYP